MWSHARQNHLDRDSKVSAVLEHMKGSVPSNHHVLDDMFWTFGSKFLLGVQLSDSSKLSVRKVFWPLSVSLELFGHQVHNTASLLRPCSPTPLQQTGLWHHWTSTAADNSRRVASKMKKSVLTEKCVRFTDIASLYSSCSYLPCLF